MSKLQEDKMVPITIDLTVAADQIDETYLRGMGASIELAIKRMFGLNNLDFLFRGPKTKLGDLGNALDAEYQYMRAFQRAGLNDPGVLANRSKLERAVRHFEASTGIKWPLK